MASKIKRVFDPGAKRRREIAVAAYAIESERELPVYPLEYDVDLTDSRADRERWPGGLIAGLGYISEV